ESLWLAPSTEPLDMSRQHLLQTLKMTSSATWRSSQSNYLNKGEKMTFRHLRKQKGITLVEFAAAASLYLPLLFAIIFVIMETSAAYVIKTNIDAAAKQAGRSLAHAYGMDPTVATDSAKQQAIFTEIRIPAYVANNAQF